MSETHGNSNAQNDETPEKFSLELSHRQLIGLFLHLVRSEPDLDEPLSMLLNDLQSIVFRYISIDEAERIEELYNNNVDLLDASRRRR